MTEYNTTDKFGVVKIQITVDEKLYVKDPNSSGLGRKIIKHSIELIDKIGFESFTFKKLATEIGTTEPSVYRYFESKHKLLLYLLDWYWNWVHYKFMQVTSNIADPTEKLTVSLKLITQAIANDPAFEHIDEVALYHIVVQESSNVYLNKEVDKVNKEGLYRSYKRLCNVLAEIVREINPDYRYPTALISTVIESSHDQRFFAEHLPSLTDVSKDEPNDTTVFLTEMVMRTIR
jgi:AcrR family transcriptional regulator